MRLVTCVILAAFLAVCFIASPASTGGKLPAGKLPAGSKLPGDILADIKNRFPGAKVVKFVDETNQVEVEVQLKSGSKIELVYAPKTVTVTLHVYKGQEIAVKALPIAVTNGVAKQFPGSTIKAADRVINAKGKLLGFEVVVATKTGEVAAYIRPDGTVTNDEFRPPVTKVKSDTTAVSLGLRG